jgi:membrane-bound metal-dependent hydrolase YbcI (DUF457 family)
MLLIAIHITGHVRWLVETPLAAVVGFVSMPMSVALVMVLVVAMLAHVLADELTDGGTPLFWPHEQRYSLHLFHTGSDAETFIRIGLYALLAVMLVVTFAHSGHAFAVEWQQTVRQARRV